MLKASLILSLAVSAMAGTLSHEEDVAQQVVRIGGIGSSFIEVKGVLEPIDTPDDSGIPSFHLKYIGDGVPADEEESVRFRCSVMRDLQVPQPILICRRKDLERTNRDLPIGGLILSAIDLGIPGNIYDLYLSLGHSLWQKIGETQAAILSQVPPIVPISVPIYIPGTVRSLELGDLKVVKSSHPFKTFLTYDVPPTTRVRRQFGGGFSGSGAQAGASSFGGGGGFGGFPGGGFGGGFSGSQASAGAGSFGGGGGFVG